MTIVDRATRCITAWAVVWERSAAVLQQLLDGSPYATTYYTDGFLLYQAGIDAGIHHPMSAKSQTYSVEGVNAELRHYLARLARASRCFSRSLHALHKAVKLFVYAWNRRQLTKRRFPTYPAHLSSFVL
jgi:IS1 family transposase